MAHVREKNQLHNKEVSPHTYGEQKGKGITKTRMAWSVIALLAAGFFLHDAVWHLMLVLFGMNALVENTPAVRHLALRQLLDLPENAPDVCQASAAAMQTDPIASILAAQQPEGFWVKSGPGYAPKYRGTVWQVIFLDQLGADGRDSRVRAACEYVLSHTQAETGGFRTARTTQQVGDAPGVLRTQDGIRVEQPDEKVAPAREEQATQYHRGGPPDERTSGQVVQAHPAPQPKEKRAHRHNIQCSQTQHHRVEAIIGAGQGQLVVWVHYLERHPAQAGVGAVRSS